MTIFDGPSFNRGMNNLHILAMSILQVEMKIVMELYLIDH